MKKAEIINILKDNCITPVSETGSVIHVFDDSNLNLVAEELEFKINNNAGK